MKQRVLIANPTVVVNQGAVLSSGLKEAYGTKITRHTIEGLRGLITFINSNKNVGTVFIIEGEYSEEIVAELKKSGLRFGMIQKDPTTKKWTTQIYNGPVLAVAGR